MATNKGISKLFFVILVTCIVSSQAYKPVVLLHGILSNPLSMELIKSQIQTLHPDTDVIVLNRYNNWNSITNIWKQIAAFREDLKKICEYYKEGVILIGYSQGGLIARALLQSYPEHNVKTFISLSSPQAGQFGSSFLHLIFPKLVSKEAYEIFYSYVGQKTSVGNYWKDPHQIPLYLNYSKFLPFVNNELLSQKSRQYKEAILKLEKMILIGGPDDGVITPWQSAHFEFFDKDKNVRPLQNSSIFISDSIGLKTLHDTGRLIIITKPYVKHVEWHINPFIIEKVIIPYLD